MPAGEEGKDRPVFKALQYEVARRRRDWKVFDATTDGWGADLGVTVLALRKETEGLWDRRGGKRDPSDEERRAYCMTLLDMAASCLMTISFEMKDVPATEELTGWLRRF